jgi:hypothetical protein
MPRLNPANSREGAITPSKPPIALIGRRGLTVPYMATTGWWTTVAKSGQSVPRLVWFLFNARV